MTGERPALAPRAPKSLHPLAREILEELCSYPEASAVIIGGGVALQHYLEFRETVDLDAWWAKDPPPQAESTLREVMRRVAERHGYDLSIRSWRETQSYDLKDGPKKVFSFQIAQRSVELAPHLASCWPPVRLEAFEDNLGAKMNAVVGRGAPRDLLDVHEICLRGLSTERHCWEAWRLKNPQAALADGQLRALHNLETLEARRPLASIVDPEERLKSEAVRRWVKESFCRSETGLGD